MSNRSFVQAVILALLLGLGAAAHGYLSSPAAAIREQYRIILLEQAKTKAMLQGKADGHYEQMVGKI